MDFRKDLFAGERNDDLNEVGRPTQRQDALGHVTGRSRFFDDYAVPGMAHMKFARSPHHHARIRSMDVREAAQMPGVVRVLTADDVPKKVPHPADSSRSGPRRRAAARGSTRAATAASRWPR